MTVNRLNYILYYTNDKLLNVSPPCMLLLLLSDFCALWLRQLKFTSDCRCHSISCCCLKSLFSEEDRELRLGIQNDTLSLTFSEDVDLEVERYKTLPPIPMAENPVVWWWEKRAGLPLFTTIATSYLCAQASSTPSERVFSTAGNTISLPINKLKERSRLLPEKANM